MALPLNPRIADMLSESEKKTIEDILLIVTDANTTTTDTGEDCKARCEAAAVIGNAGCDAMDSPIGKAACRLAVKVIKDTCTSNC